MTTAAQVQQVFAAANRGSTLDTASATSIASSIDSSGGTFTLANYSNSVFESNQDSTGAALQLFSFITGKTEANAADLTTVAKTTKTFVDTYTAAKSANPGLGAWLDLGAQLADNATGTSFRATYGSMDNSTFLNSVYNQIFGVTPSGFAQTFYAARLTELTNFYKGFTDANDPTGATRAKGALVGELLKNGEDANVGSYHNAAVSFVAAEGTTAPASFTLYGGSLLNAGSGGGSGVTQGTGSGAGNGIAYTTTLTPAANANVNTTAGDLTTKSTAGNDYVKETVTVAGTIVDLGGGTDALELLTTGNIAPTILNTEFLLVTPTAAASAFDMTNVDAANTSVYVKSEATGWAMTINNIKLGTVLGVVDADQTNASGAATFKFVASQVTGTSDAADLTLNGVTGNPAVTVDAIELLTVRANGNASTATLADSTLQTLTILGDKALTLTTPAATVTKIDASGDTGILNLTTGDLANKATITLGQGADTLTTTDTKAHQISGGAGIDTFNIDASTAAKTTLNGTDTATGANALITTKVLSILDWQAGETLNIDTAGGTGVAADHSVVILTGTQLAQAAAQATLFDAATFVNGILGASAAAKDIETTFKYGGDTYVFVEQNASGATLTTDDALIRVVGDQTLVLQQVGGAATAGANVFFT